VKSSSLFLKFEESKKFLAGFLGKSRVGGGRVQRNGLAQAVEICRAVWTSFEVAFEFQAFGRRELGVQLLANVVQNVVAMDSFLLHAVM
jgi:hypothetical protein